MFNEISTIPILMVGAGNVAWHLGSALHRHGLPVSMVWSRNIINASILADKLSVKATDEINEIINFKGIILFSVPDHSIPFFASQTFNENAVIIHTSGSLSISVFENCSVNRGVFYPLQTFKKDKTEKNFKDLPVLVESSNESVDNILNLWAKSISAKIYNVNSLQRLKMHIAAVFACNFTNHLVSISKQIMDENDLDNEMLKPLLSESLTNILKFDSMEIQTGPAIRKDMDTIQKHIEIMGNQPELAEIYRALSESIIKMHFKE